MIYEPDYEIVLINHYVAEGRVPLIDATIVIVMMLHTGTYYGGTSQ
jgi:hypothetical protein